MFCINKYDLKEMDAYCNTFPLQYKVIEKLLSEIRDNSVSLIDMIQHCKLKENRKKSIFFIVHKDNCPIAFCRTFPLSHYDFSNIKKLSNLKLEFNSIMLTLFVVDKSHRCQKIGYNMMKYILQYYCNHNIYLEILANNITATLFFQSFKFKKISSYVRYSHIVDLYYLSR